MVRRTRNHTVREYLRFYSPGVLLIVISVVVAYKFVEPAPPKQITIATGQPEGTYYHLGERYREILARDGIDVKVLRSSGAVENLRLLETGEADIAFLKGGIGSMAEPDKFISLGSLYYEPLWVFLNTNLPAKSVLNPKGLRIDIGREGSGTVILVKKFLDRIGVKSEDVTMSSFGGSKAADLLAEGKLDLAFMIYGYQAPVVQKLLRADTIRVWSAKRAEAFYRYYRFLSIVTLPEGYVDLAANIPAHDITLLAATTQLVTSSDLHPALIDVVLSAAQELHGTGGVFEKPGEFPAPKQMDFKVSKETERFYESGPTFFRRYLPFWLATFLDRMKIMLIPLVALLYPFFKIMPSLYRWRIRSKIYRRYRELQELDPAIQSEGRPVNIEENLERLNRMEENVAQISVPLAYREAFYDFRMHIDLLRNKLAKSLKEEKKIR
jgi:TRAP transporter TAXI family solute receptor